MVDICTYEHLCEIGWDDAIEHMENNNADNVDISFLCKMYWDAYQTTQFLLTGDPDEGLCFEIRNFVIGQIHKILDEAKPKPKKIQRTVGSPYERARAAVYATGNKWAIENFHATHD